MAAPVISRRSLLKAAGAFGFGAAVSPVAAFAESKIRSVGEQCYQAYRASLQTAPWLGGLRSMDEDHLRPLAMSLEGRVPAGLSGTLFRNGPAGLERNGVRYQHWFDGDGMVQAFRIGRRGITHEGRKVQTAKYREETTAGRFVYGGAGSVVPNSRRSSNTDATNPANISVVPYDGRLLALWEAASAHEIDPQTLETSKVVEWSSETARLPFSAHPVVDADGSLWNFGLAQWAGPGVLLLYHVKPKLGLVRTGKVTLPFRGYAHSFAATERWLVLYLSPNVFDFELTGRYVARHRWRPELGGKVLLVDKNDFSNVQWIDAPPGFVFHMVGAADAPDGGVRFHACWNDNADMMNKTMTDIMWGRPAHHAARLSTIHVSRKGAVRVDAHDPIGEFPIVDPRACQARRLYVAYQHGQAPWLNAIGAYDTKTGRLDGYHFGDDVLVEEHRFVPRNPDVAPDVGWLVGTFFNARKQTTGLSIFDAQRVAEGPVLRASMDRALPLGFHGWFWPS